ncbi:MAG: C40 family peptidase [Acidothermaceae bacterium]
MTARRAAVGVVAAISASVVVTSVLPSSAAFAAKPKTSTAAEAAQAQAKADALGVQADKAVEAFNAAQAKLAAATAQAHAQEAAVAKAKQQFDIARAGIQALAAAEYETGSLNSSINYLLSDDPEVILQKAAMLSQVNRAQTANLTKVINADRQVESAQAAATQALAAQQAAATKLAASKSAVQKALAAQQAVLSTLQTKVKQEQAAAVAAARAASVHQQTASRSTNRVAIKPHAEPGATTVGIAPVAASGGAKAALAFAYSQLGKPYRYGGAGPGSFDCSGLAMRAWGAAGVSLSHSAAAQQHEGTRVSMSALQPGDLVFWGSPAYHVGIYVGGGRILDAPHTGTVVQIQSIWGHPSGAVRP